MQDLRSLINPEVEGNIKLAQQKMQEIDNKIKELLKTERYTSLPDQHKKKYIDNFMDVLEGAVKRSEIDTTSLSARRLEAAEERAVKSLICQMIYINYTDKLKIL